MKKPHRLIWIGASVLAFGSAVAFAQSVAISAPDVPGSIIIPEATQPPIELPEPVVEPEPIVEDAPIDMPQQTTSDWLPDINLDVVGQGALSQAPRAQVSSRPRKALSDAGENLIGAGGQNLSSAAAEAALVARSKRRERPIDPVKRSELTRLSRVMGALHALRVSCAGRDDQTYRSRMATMLDLEAPQNGALRDPLVDAFNGGFQAYGRGANPCPGDFRAQEASLAKDGMAVAKALSVRYRPAPMEQAKLPPATQPRVNVALPPKTESQTPSPSATRPNWGNGTAN